MIGDTTRLPVPSIFGEGDGALPRGIRPRHPDNDDERARYGGGLRSPRVFRRTILPFPYRESGASAGPGLRFCPITKEEWMENPMNPVQERHVAYHMEMMDKAIEKLGVAKIPRA